MTEFPDNGRLPAKITFFHLAAPRPKHPALIDSLLTNDYSLYFNYQEYSLFIAFTLIISDFKDFRYLVKMKRTIVSSFRYYSVET